MDLSPNHRGAQMGLAFGLLALSLVLSRPARADFPDDLSLSYGAIYIPRAQLAEETLDTEFLHQFLEVEFGLGDFGLGFELRNVGALREFESRDETGLMLTARYAPVLSEGLRVDAQAKVGLTHHVSDPNSALYATESELRLDLVAFSAEGWGHGADAVYPSAHAGAALNWLGRPQLAGGAGLWWRQWSAYGTLYWSLSGVDDPLGRDAKAPNRFANLNDAGVSFALSWELDLGHDRTLRLESRQDIPLRNGGFDTALSVSLRWSWVEASTTREMAW